MVALGLGFGLASAARAAEPGDGYALLAAEDPAAARRVFEDVVATNPGDAAGWRGLALACLELGDYDAAVVATTRLRELLPGDDEVTRLHLLALRATESGRSEAIAAYRSMVERDPNDLDACIKLAETLSWASQRLGPSVRVFRRCLRVAPGDPNATTELADVLRRLGRNAEADALVSKERSAEASVLESWGRDSTGFTRQALAVRSELGRDHTRGRIEATWTRFSDQEAALDRLGLGGRLERDLGPGFAARMEYVLQLQEQTDPTHQLEGQLRFAAPDKPVFAAIGGRRRSLADTVAERQDLGVISGVAAGGVDVLGLRDRFQTNEVWVTGWSRPMPPLDVFADVTLGRLTDGNTSRSLSAGASVDVLTAIGKPGNHRLEARYGLWSFDLRDATVDYWSPDKFLSHTTTLRWGFAPREGRWLSVEGGAQLRVGAPPGLQLAVGARWTLGEHLFAQGRFLVSDSTDYRVTSLELRLGGRP